jgi:predicted short-subunit dehydrogenase-like oxidoreductase (DUF2520 family)
VSALSADSQPWAHLCMRLYVLSYALDKWTANIGFIGIGVLGKGLALSLAAQGYRVAAAHSRNPASAQWLADRVSGCHAFATAQELANVSDLVFITTPDLIIGEIARSVAWHPGQGVAHCCGAASTEILRCAAGQGAVTGAFHPFQTFAGIDSPKETAARLNGVTFAVAGEGWVADFLRELAFDLGGRPVFIRDTDRPLYHASAVLGCGYLVALLEAAVEVWQMLGFTPQEAINALYPLARVTLENVSKHGVLDSVTGPVVRGDTVTVQSHLVALSQQLPELARLYCALTAASLPLAAQRGIEPGQIEALRELVNSYSWRSESWLG